MTRPPAPSSTPTPAAAGPKRHRRRPSHPASMTDPFNALDSDSTEYATGAPAGLSTTDLHPDFCEITVDPAHGGTEADLAAYSTRDLKSWLRARGRSMQGTKPQLVHRVWQLLNSDDSDYSSDADADDERGGGDSDASGFWTDTSTTAAGVAPVPAGRRPPRNRRHAPSPATLEELIMTPIEQQPFVREMSRRAEQREREREMDAQPISNEAMAQFLRRIRDRHGGAHGREPAGGAAVARD
ncbi:hypothetical protein AMAG_06959 [Allomyces macrogynus ATCC 38327]|uniref:SAP domain-containing protein n=1 Tax=Allomyces macrogynus (strain ATCC 38327) TaxID=578462 RepID=A0A0L0SFD2_ALLM3|nr:hypothetical protein AMAG_06959 [Allomyces macrogynus ATCC 38327]|eukprot:KNE61211.1 hypothetical protein AMAG_06959 [Allomyces macrogynus ATCC 38327]